LNPLTQDMHALALRPDQGSQNSENVWTSGFQKKSWKYTLAIVSVACALISLLIYCNVRYIGHVWVKSQTTNHGETKTILDEDAYDINLMTDVKQLWTNCLEANGQKTCNADAEEKKWEKELAVVLFIWSICFPFIKLALSLIFWFIPSAKWFRESVMYIKVHIGRWSLIEVFMLWTWIYCLKWDLEFAVRPKIHELTFESCFYLDDWGAVFVIAQLASLGLSHVVMHLMEEKSEPGSGGGATLNEQPEQAEYSEFYCKAANAVSLLFATGNLVTLYYIMVIDPVLKFEFQGLIPDVLNQLEHKTELTMWELVTESNKYACGDKILAVMTCYLTLLICPVVSSISLFWWRFYTFCFPAKVTIRKGWKRITEVITVYNCLDVIILSLQFTNLYFPKIFRSLIISASDQRLDRESADKILHGAFDYTFSYKLLYVYAIAHWFTYFFSEWQDKKIKDPERLEPYRPLSAP